MNLRLSKLRLAHLLGRHAASPDEDWEFTLGNALETVRAAFAVMPNRRDDQEAKQQLKQLHSELLLWICQRLLELTDMGIQWPFFVEYTRVERRQLYVSKPQRTKSIVTPTGVTVIARVGGDGVDKVWTAYAVEKSDGSAWKTAARRLLRRYCRIREMPQSFKIPDVSKPLHFSDNSNDGAKVTESDIRLHSLKTFGFHLTRVTSESWHSFPSWPAAEHLDAPQVPVEILRIMNPTAPPAQMTSQQGGGEAPALPATDSKGTTSSTHQTIQMLAAGYRLNPHSKILSPPFRPPQSC